MNGGLAMFPIVATRHVARGIKLFEIKAPRIAKKQRPGQFVIVRLNDTGERIHLTLADANPEAGTITIAVQAIGKTTRLLNMLEAGDSILDVVGPLGKPSEIDNFGTAVVVSGSVGSAMAYPTARELKRAGNKVNSIMVDGTGMCGGCRVLVNSRSQFACVDGPEFDASQVNFDVLTQRNNMYREQEKKSIELFQANLEAELA